MTTPEGQAMIGKYMVMSSPGIVIDGELFSQGGLDKSKLIDKLKKKNITLDRKILSSIATDNPKSFERILKELS